MIRNVAAAVLTVAALATSAPFAVAGHCGSVSYDDSCHDYHDEYVITYKVKKVPEVVCVVAYDDCGHAYKVHKVVYRTVKVPVKTLVRVYDEHAVPALSAHVHHDGHIH